MILSLMKLQIDRGMWYGFDFYYIYLDRIYRIIRIFFPCGEGPSGRRPHCPDDPACRGVAERRLVDPVQLFSLKYESIPFFLSYSIVFYLIRLDACGRRRGSYEADINKEWWRCRDLNPGHCGYEPHALTT
jgi:hypothetical protein